MNMEEIQISIEYCIFIESFAQVICFLTTIKPRIMKMKIFLVCLIALLIVANTCRAQDTSYPRSDIRLSYGITTVDEVSLGMNYLIFGAFFVAPFSHDTVFNVNVSGYGGFSFQYSYRISKVVSIGGVISFNPVKSSITFDHKTYGAISSYFITLMPRVDFTYIRRGIFSMYSGFAIGGTYAIMQSNYSNKPDDTTTGFLLGFQLNCVGFRVGKDIGGFAEFGFGNQGIINLGLSARL